MAPELADKLGKVLAMLTSPHDGERLAAAARFTALLAAHDIHPSPLLRAFAEAKGWSVELTTRRTVCRKARSVVFGSGDGASEAAYKDLIPRLRYVDGFMARCQRARP